jgi:hypothetical protein
MRRLRTKQELLDFISLLSGVMPCYKLERAERIVCQFEFPIESDLNNGWMISSPVSVPGGSVRLMKRYLHFPRIEADSPPSCVLGVRLESPQIWIIRIISLTGDKEIDIMGGSTRADTLRVPNCQNGSWSDLLPISSIYGSNSNIIFLLEFI